MRTKRTQEWCLYFLYLGVEVLREGKKACGTSIMATNSIVTPPHLD